MIDGIKIELPISTAEKWLKCPLLDFEIKLSEDTGEIVGNTKIAKSRGLIFKIDYDTHPERRTKIVGCKVRGSLHKFYNHGEHNANDFTFNNLVKTIETLKDQYSINPDLAILHNIEVGVNVHTPIKTKEIIKNLVSSKEKDFETYYIDSGRFGKQIIQQRQRFKVYDKGLLSGTKETNLTRFEMVIKKMEAIKKSEIKCLSDLLNLDKLNTVFEYLIGWWSNIIYYDKSINIARLSEAKRRRILYLSASRNWGDFNKDQRYRAKKRFRDLMSKYGSNTQEEIRQLIVNKWEDLKPIEKLVINDYAIKSSKVKSRKTKCCTVCKTDITHKIKGAKYCSKKCNNHTNGMKRTARNRKRIIEEQKGLKRLNDLLPKGKVWLWITYKENETLYTDYLHQSEVLTSSNWIKKVVKVVADGYRKNGLNITLTGFRSRQLLRQLNRQNELQGQKGTSL